MATILLQNAGAALGGMFGPFGAMLGRAAGAVVGNRVDQALFGEGTVSAASLQGARIASSEEGTPIPRLYGTMRLAGNLIWATRFEEEITIERQGGKALTQSSSSVETKQYYANFAVGLCEGPIHQVKRIWADGRELDLTEIEYRIYKGYDDQLPDPLIEAKQGAAKTPAFRGLAYIVFDRLLLENFGNRIPVLHFEVTRVISQLEHKIEAVSLIPGATEHGLASEQVTEETADGELHIINHNMNLAQTDLIASLDELQNLCPNLKAIGLIVSWFGDDLRAGQCVLRPGVEVSARSNESRAWQVGNMVRSSAYLISQEDQSPVYGGTPDDQSVLDAIKEIKSRGLRVTLYPFILMDIPEDNTLPAPDGSASQDAFPWRGRITCNPAIGAAASADQTVEATQQISAFMGTAQISQFTITGSQISWTTNDQGYRRMILHHAYLAKLSSDLGYPIDAFVIGSEMVSLTRVRDASDGFPFVSALVTLADDVRSVLGASVDITYAADWSEYFGYHPQDGSGDVFFHLDDLWASPAITAIGIDNYMPLSDWRDEDLSSLSPDGFAIANDTGAMGTQIEGGEGYDWYYQSSEHRLLRQRTPITDGLGKPWVYRYKDIRSWWSNQHFNRVAGVESTTSTSWVPQSKPIWFTEFGAPAVDKGANQPNVFPDPKSSESAFPYFSSETRDDQAQRSFIDAHVQYWNSDQNSVQFVDPQNCYVWTWDARPFPIFPTDTDSWSDGDNWRTGHWINGRLGNAPLGELIAAILEDYGFSNYDVSAVEGFIFGYLQPSLGSARALLEPLLEAYQIDVKEGADHLIFSSRTRLSAQAQTIERLVDHEDQDIVFHQRRQENELTNELHLQHVSLWTDYAASTAYSRRLARTSQRQDILSLNGTIDDDLAALATNQWLQDHWASREHVEFSLPVTDQHLEVGDRITFNHLDDFLPQGTYSIQHIEDGTERRMSARRMVTVSQTAGTSATLQLASNDASSGFNPYLVFLDLPVLSGNEPMRWASCASFVRPFSPMVLSSSTTQDGYSARLTLAAPCTMGKLSQALSSGPEGRIDYANALLVDLSYGAFETISKDALLAGGNLLAVAAKNGAYEIIQFQNATELSSDQWMLSDLVRAQAGTDDAMRAGAAVGADVVLINDAITSLDLDSSELAIELNWRVSAQSFSNAQIPVTSFAGGIRANTPISPVHLRAYRTSDGIQLSWIRRSRYQADSWLGTDVPIDEDSLSFQVQIMQNDQILRSATVSDSQYLYANADEISDFGAQQSEISFSVYQLGGLIATGIARAKSVAL